MEKSYMGRAKQFLPYASLRGFDAVVAQKRHIKSPRRELGQDAAEELSEKLLALSRGAWVLVTYYSVDSYVTRRAEFKRIDPISKTISFSDFEIPIAELFSIELL